MIKEKWKDRKNLEIDYPIIQTAKSFETNNK